MKIFEYKNYKIVAESWETYNSWGHKATLFNGDNELTHSRIRYLNRTWECYQYQSVILDAIYEAMKRRQTRLVDDYKLQANVIRMTKRRKELLYQDDIELQELQELYNHFKERNS